MKIIGPEGLQQPKQDETRASKDLRSGEAFGDMLQRAVGRDGASSTVQKNATLSEPQAIRSFVSPAIQSGDFTGEASRAIDLLETYSDALSNPQKTLKDIEPTLSAFISETESMYNDYIESGNENAELKEIMESLLRTARSEAVRFQRGDYLDS